MKQFEKWFEETYPLPPTIERGPIGRELKVACKATYRAALECVQDIACKGGILQNDFVIREWIREELQSDVLSLEERQSE